MRSLLTTLILIAMSTYCLSFDELRLDMGTPDSPVAEGWLRVTPNDSYDAKRGHGWEQPPETAFSRNIHWPGKLPPWHSRMRDLPLDPLTRDGVESAKPMTLRIDVPKGVYVVRVWLGDYVNPAKAMTVSVNGKVIANKVSAGTGGIWGQILRAAVITVRGIVPADDGILRLSFTHASRKSSVIAVFVRRYAPPPIRLKGTKLEYLAQQNDTARQVCNLLNQNDTQTALDLTSKLEKKSDGYLKALLFEAIAGNISITNPKHVEQILAEAVQLLEKRLASPDSGRAIDPMAVAERLDLVRAFHQAVAYMLMMRYDWAYGKTKKSSYRRYREAIALAAQVLPDEPLYWQAQLLEARILFWLGREGDRSARQQAKPFIERLFKAFPDNRIVRIYAGQRVKPARSYPPPPADAPKWAAAERDLLTRILDVIRFWLAERQVETGEIGGGWGDDVEILRAWGRVAMALDIDWLNAGIAKIADGVWNYNPDLKAHGYPMGLGDVEHAAEPISDTQPLAIALNYGEPRFILRCLRSMSHLEKLWTGINTKGHRHFKSYNFGCDVVDANPKAGFDVPLNARAAKPGMWVAWYNRNPKLLRLFREWGDAWVADALRTDGGKPRGIFPAGVRFKDDSFSDPWYKTGYTRINDVWYTCTLFEQLLTNWLCTGDERYLTPMHETLKMAADQWRSPADGKPGSRAWAGKTFQSGTFLNVVGKWRLISGDRRHDAMLARHGPLYIRHLLNGCTEEDVVAQLEQAVKANSRNFEMLTSEVLFTDRVWLSGTERIYALYGGGTGDLSGCPGQAVRWENAGDDLAAWVLDATKRTFRARTYSFAQKPKEFGIQLWRLSPGRYRLLIRSDYADSEPIESKEIVFRHRGDTVPITLPPKQACLITLSQLEQFDWDPGKLPDLAIGDDGEFSADDKTFTCSIVNLGSPPAASVTVRLLSDGEPVAERIIRTLPGMTTMQPVKHRLEYELTRQVKSLMILVDPEDRINEITERNNRRQFPR